MEDKEFSMAVNKLLKKIVLEKQNISMEEFADKYNLPPSIRRQIKLEFISCTITDVWIILEYLKVTMSEFVEMLENEVSKNDSK